jgi:adenylyltransferase/sulfurtransferase
LEDRELLRYSRQIMLPQIGIAGQERLRAAHTLIVGLGGLGAPAALYLAAAGVGHLTLADGDVVDLPNLQRQIIHHSDDIGRAKVESARERLLAINPEASVHTLAARLDADALAAAVHDVGVVLDCTDNFATRFALNAACVRARKPLISGAAIRMEGQLSVFDARRSDSPCYRCLYPEGPELAESCSETGVLAPLVGVIGSLQAVEAIKLITGIGKSLVGRLLLFDALHLEWRELRLPKDPRCPVCG